MNPDVIHESIAISAPIERCFALSTRIELVQRILGMTPVDGVTSGHITASSRVHWRGWKFGLPTNHHTLITGFEPTHADPSHANQRVAFFEDTQEQGRFASFRHEHFFREQNGVTTLEDRIHFSLPFGILGRMAARYLLAPHIQQLARRRFAMIKELAEGEGWREWV